MKSTTHEPASMTGADSQTLSTRIRTISPTAIVGGLVWLGALLLYAFTAGPGIVELFDDSLEFQYVAPTFGIAHPTGYPLYTLAGGLWSRVLFPFGNWAWRMNVFSALAAATAVLLVYLIAARLVPHANGRANIWAGLAAAAAFALGPIWWSQATVAEVYALNGLFMAAILLVALTIPPLYADQQSPKQQGTASRRMLLICFLIGLSLTHHRTALLLLPGLAVYLLWSVPGLWRPRKEWLLWIGAFLLPLALYLYLPIRAGQGMVDLNGSYVNTVQGFFDHVLARQYTSFFAGNSLGGPLSTGDALNLVQRQFGIVAVLLAVIGFAAMPFRGANALRNWTLLALILVANLVFAVRYQVADREVFFIPVFLILSLFVGIGVGILAGLLNGRPRLVTAGAAVLAMVVVIGLGGRGAPVNRSSDWGAHQYAYLLANVAFPSQSRVIGLEGEMTALKYMQASEKLAQNALPITVDDPAERKKMIAESTAVGYPTYITRELPGIEEQYSFSGEGPLVRVWPRGRADVNPPVNPLDVELLDERLRLQGYELRTLDLPGGPVLELTLGWLPVAQANRTVKVSLRLLDETGAPVLDAAGEPVVEDRFPIRQVAPSSAWTPGVLVRDVHYLPVPRQGSGGPAFVQVIVYDADTVGELARFELPVP